MSSPKQLWARLVKTLRGRRYRHFWENNGDRKHMKLNIYPAIGELFRGRTDARILDIGCQWYNVDNYRLFENEEIEYWSLDPVGPPTGLVCHHFLRDSIFDLEVRRPDLVGFFDLIISYGVLGFYPFSLEQASTYLRTCHRLLKPDGLLLWKLDVTRMSRQEAAFRFDSSVATPFFQTTSRNQLIESQTVRDEGHEYQFLTLTPRPE